MVSSQRMDVISAKNSTERADLQRSKYDRFAEELRPSVELSIIYTAYKNTQYALSPYLESGENRHFFFKSDVIFFTSLGSFLVVFFLGGNYGGNYGQITGTFLPSPNSKVLLTTQVPVRR